MNKTASRVIRRSARGVAATLFLSGAAWAGWWAVFAPYPILQPDRLRLLLATFGLGATGAVLAFDAVVGGKNSTPGEPGNPALGQKEGEQ